MIPDAEARAERRHAKETERADTAASQAAAEQDVIKGRRAEILTQLKDLAYARDRAAEEAEQRRLAIYAEMVELLREGHSLGCPVAPMVTAAGWKSRQSFYNALGVAEVS